VQAQPPVRCLLEQGRVSFTCATANHSDGSPVQLGDLGIPAPEDHEVVWSAYMRALDDVSSRGVLLDAALVDGRFRISSALKLLHVIHSESVVFIHDFWPRVRPSHRYGGLLGYYDVIGRARSAVALRRKPPQELPSSWKHAFEEQWARTIYA
jgi:hypothetical protein